MKLFVCVLTIFALFACTKKENLNTKKLDVPDSSIASNNSNFKIEKIPESCYLMVTGKDSAAIHLVDNLGTFSGNMAVKNSEKDSSTGELTGFKNEDTLKLTYTFKSEGITSESSLYFLQKDNELIEGLGDYKNPKTLKFDSKNNYKKVNCNQVTNLLK